MASQVLSGTSNPSYTNTTGENVRIIINYMQNVSSISWSGVSVSANMAAIGRNLATSYIRIDDAPNSPVERTAGTGFGGISIATYTSLGLVSNNNGLARTTNRNDSYTGGIAGTIIEGSGSLPTELMLAPNQTFSATCGAYNIVAIPEAG